MKGESMQEKKSERIITKVIKDHNIRSKGGLYARIPQWGKLQSFCKKSITLTCIPM